MGATLRIALRVGSEQGRMGGGGRMGVALRMGDQPSHGSPPGRLCMGAHGGSACTWQPTWEASSAQILE